MDANKLDKQNRTGKNFEGPHPNEKGRYLTASSVMKDHVINTSGENLGKIHDIMLDLEGGKIEYVVIEFGGFLGIGEKLFAVPFSALKLDTKHHAFIMDKDRSFLENAPGFNKEHWPETNLHYYEVNSYWGSFVGPNAGGF